MGGGSFSGVALLLAVGVVVVGLGVGLCVLLGLLFVARLLWRLRFCFGFLLAGLVDEGVHVFEDAVLDFLGDFAGVVIEGEALVGTGHALADEADVVFDLIGVYRGVAPEEILGVLRFVGVGGGSLLRGACLWDRVRGRASSGRGCWPEGVCRGDFADRTGGCRGR